MSKIVKKELKLRRPHPASRFFLGKHTITNVFQTYELSEAELKELGTAGPQYWVISKDEQTKKPAKTEEKE